MTGHRRLVLAGAVLLLALSAAAMAGAHPDDDPNAPNYREDAGWTKRKWGEPTPVAAGARFAADPLLPVVFAHEPQPFQDGIERVEIEIGPAADGAEPAEGCGPTQPAPRSFATPDQPLPDEVAHGFVTAFPCNGRYRATATATTGAGVHDPETSPEIRLVFDVVKPAPTPASLTVSLTERSSLGAALVVWSPPNDPPPDLVGYVVERAPSAGGAFEQVRARAVGDKLEFVDSEVGGTGGVFRYRVFSVRLGAGPGELVPSAATGEASVQIPRPANPSTSVVGDRGGAPTGFGDLQQQAEALGGGTVAPGAASPPTTADTGFADRLPFGPDATAEYGTEGDPLADSFQELEDGGDAKSVLAPLAAALLLFVGFLQVRFLLRQASRPAPVVASTEDPLPG